MSENATEKGAPPPRRRVYLMERLYRDVRAFRIGDGPSEVHRMAIARQVLKSASGERKTP